MSHSNNRSHSIDSRSGLSQQQLAETTLPEAIAAATGRSPTEGPPLQESVDVDALRALLDGDSEVMSVSFVYDGVRVTIEGDGTVRAGE